MSENSIKTTLPIFNSEEKVDEINRLLDILSKRKRYSILVAMLLVFQKYNFQKLLKEFLVEGVQQIILANPFKVVSFGGVPFTIKNCFMGMRVIIGKHRIFQKELVDGYEYLNVNLVYTCIFLTDEIAKICKGSKNHKPVHSSLLDELDIIENNNNNSQSGTNSSIGGPSSTTSKNYSQNNSTTNTSSHNNNNNNMLNEKRKRTNNNNTNNANNNDSEDEEGEGEGEEEQEEEEEEEEDDSKDSGYKEKNTKKKNTKNKSNNKNNNTKNKEKQNTKVNNNNHHNNNNNETTTTQKEKKAKSSENLIDLCDSEESEDRTNNKTSKNNNTKNKNNKKNSNNNKNGEKEKEKEKENPIAQLFANIFYPKDVNYFKCSIQDFLTVWNFDKSSPVNVYLKDNYQNISKIKNVFAIMQNIGAKGQNYLEKLIKYVPELNPAANLTEEEKAKINENEDLKESKEILDSINSINSIYKEYENKKKKLINIYQRIKSTAENIKIGAISEGKLMMKEDFEYLDMINKRFDQIMTEIIPIFNQLCDYNKECMLKNISFNLQNVSRNLKENDLTLKAFSILTQNLTQLFPREPSEINTVNDLILTESISVEKRDEIFRDIISREKNILLNSIEQYNIYRDKNKNNNNNNDDNNINVNDNKNEGCDMEEE